MNEEGRGKNADGEEKSKWTSWRWAEGLMEDWDDGELDALAMILVFCFWFFPRLFFCLWLWLFWLELLVVKLYHRMGTMYDTMHENRKYIHHCNRTNLAFFYFGFPSSLLLCCWSSGGKSQPAHNQRASQLIHTSGFEPFFAFLHSPPEHPRLIPLHHGHLCRRTSGPRTGPVVCPGIRLHCS